MLRRIKVVTTITTYFDVPDGPLIEEVKQKARESLDQQYTQTHFAAGVHQVHRRSVPDAYVIQATATSRVVEA